MAILYQAFGNRPLEGPPEADVVFVHGLGGDPLTTWKSPEFDWPDWVAGKFPNRQVWKLGYSTSAFLEKGIPFQDQAKDVLASLVNHGLGSRPIAFICHSLGGILIKQVLRAAEPKNSEYHTVFANTRLVSFVATPHTGSSLANVLAHLRRFHIGSNEALQLRVDAPPLRDLNEWYRLVAPETIRTAAFYETQRFLGALVVSVSNADPGVVHCLPIPIQANHITIAKPAGSSDEICLTVLRLLRETGIKWTPPADHTRQMRMGYPAANKWSQTAAQVRERIGLLAEEFYGREGWLADLDKFVASNRTGLLILSGPAGAGKSALMARWVQLRVNAGDIVARHFISTQFDKTSAPEHALGHLIVQLKEATGDDEGTYFESAETLSQTLYDLLNKPGEAGKRRIIVLDGLDEASSIILPFVETVLADNTFVVVTARVGDEAVPPFLTPWVDRLKRGAPGVHLRLSGLDVSDTQLWIETLCPGLKEKTELAIQFEEVAQGLPLFVRYILQDLAFRYGPGIETSPSNEHPDPFGLVPGSLTEYIRAEMQRPSRSGEPPWDRSIKSLFAVLTQARGPLRFAELVAIRPLMPDLFSLPTRFSRWLSVSEGNGEKQMSLAHPLIGRSFEVVLGQNESENALRDLVSWASDAWKPRTPANPLFGSERSGALYPLRWLVEHLLEFPRTGPSAARSLLLDPEWLERKIASGLEFEVLRDFSIVIASLDPDGPVILLRLVADAFRNNLHHIIDSFTDYPQILTQAILNYLRPLHPSTLGTESSDLPPSVTPSILDLTTSWEARARTRGWSWINLTWIDRKRAFLGEQQWQAKMGARPADHLAFSPSGASVAAASKWLYTNRENPPSEWPMAYDIAVWSARDGKLLDRPRPDANSVRLDDLPEDIPRPDAADKVFRAYFAHRKKQQETSPVAPLAFDFSSWVEAPKPVEEDDPITWEVGHHWTETLIAGDVDALVWLDEKTLLASGRGGRIFGFDTVARTQSLMVQQSNVDAELVVRDWRETKIGSLERISATAFAAGTGFGTVEIRDLQSPDQTKEYRVEPIEDRSVSRTAVRALSYDAASGYLAIGLTDASVRVIEVGSGREVRRFLGHGQDIIGLAWAPSGDRLASISYDRTLRVWSLETGGEVITPVEHPMDTLSLAWGIDDEQILTTWNENGKGGTIRIWKATSGELVSEFGAGTALIEAMAVSRETGLVAAGGKDGYVRVFDPKSHGITRMPARSHRTSIRDASLAVSRMELATLSLDGILVWSCTTGEVVNSYKAEWERYLAWTTCVLYSPAEDRLAAVLGNSVYMFEANTLSLLWCHSAGPRDIRFCRFSGDGKYFLTDDDKDPPEGNGSVLWEAETGEPIARSKQHGFEAEMVLYDYDNLISEEVNSSPSGSTSLTKWKSVMRNIENTGLTRIHLTDADGRSHEFILEAAIQRSFRLPAIGRWVFIIRGGRAPVMASVVWA